MATLVPTQALILTASPKVPRNRGKNVTLLSSMGFLDHRGYRKIGQLLWRVL